MPPSCRIAVVSDLHVAESARAGDLQVIPTRTESGYQDEFRRFVRRHRISADVLVPGDLTDRASPEEFQTAFGVILHLAESLSVSRERVVIVPGNHDVNWAVVRLGADYWRQQRFGPMQDQVGALAGAVSADGRHVCQQPYFAIWNFEEVLIVGHNSAAFDLPDRIPRRGDANQETIEEIEEALVTYNVEPEKIKVFVTHHHAFQYSGPVTGEADFSIMMNAENLLAMLNHHSFDLFIHGHKHMPRFFIHSTDMAVPLPILGAGSFSVLLDPRFSGYVNDQFHLIHIEGRDRGSRHVYGKVLSWTYLTAHRWQPSHTHTHTQHSPRVSLRPLCQRG